MIRGTDDRPPPRQPARLRSGEAKQHREQVQQRNDPLNELAACAASGEYNITPKPRPILEYLGNRQLLTGGIAENRPLFAYGRRCPTIPAQSVQ